MKQVQLNQPTSSGTTTQITSKIRKASAHRFMPVQPVDVNLKLGSSKERLGRKPSNQMALSANKPFGQSDTLNNVARNNAYVEEVDDYQQHVQLIASLQSNPLQQYDKLRRNIKSNAQNPQFKNRVESAIGYNLRDMHSDDIDQNYFNKNNEDDIKVEDYNSTNSLNLNNQLHTEENEGDYENSRTYQRRRATANKQENNYDEDYRDLDQPDIRIPAFLGNQSLEDKGQFYMTQIINQNHLQNLRSGNNAKQQTASASQSSGNLKVSRGLKLKGSTKKMQTANTTSSLSKSYASATMKNLHSAVNQAQRFVEAPSSLTIGGQIAQFHNFNIGEGDISQEQVPSRLKGGDSSSANKRQSIINISANGGTLINHQGKLSSAASLNVGGKDFFNSTAPISNMNKLNQNYVHRVGAGFSEDQNDTSTYNLNRINSKAPIAGFSSSYYSGVNNPHVSAHKSNIGQHKSSMSPLKTAKKQMLIQSILNQETPTISRSGSKSKHSGKFFLNLTLSQLMQNQNSKEMPQQMMQSQELIQQAINYHNQQQQQKRLNKTLDNFKVPHENNYTSSYHPELSMKADSNQVHKVPRVNEFRTNSSAKLNNNHYQHLKQQVDGTASSQKSKFASTMRVSDFNQTQQLADLKLATNVNPLSDQLRVMGRKSKNSLKSTQNLNLEDHRKSSALQIYSSNIAQTTTSNNKIKKSIQNAIGKDQLSSIHIDTLKNNSSKQQLSKHRKQSSQGGDNEREILKKMMNFYQDDFLQQFNLKNNNIDNTLLQQKGGFYQGNKSNSAQKNSKQNSKHKANSILNQYLILQQQQLQQTKPNTALNLHNPSNPLVMMFNEPLLVTSKNNKGQSDDGQEESSQLLAVHPYNHLKHQQNSRKNSGSNGQMFMKRGDLQHHHQQMVKDFQNKTQPIPKSILEMAAAAATHQVNLSTGISVVGVVNKMPSKDSGLHQNSQKSKNSSKVRSGPQGASSNIPKKTISQIRQQAQQQQQIQRTALNVIPPLQFHPVKAEDPSDVYQNKKASILDTQMIKLVRPYDQEDPQIEDEQELDQESQASSDGNAKLNRFQLGKQIGQGAYAVVRVATSKKDNAKYAIKVYDKSKLTDTNRQRSVRREIKLLQKMNHANIVKIFEAFETDDHVYLVMEYVGGGSLHSYLKEKQSRRLEEEDAKRIFKQILTALSYCHRKSIAHRDIKLENILLDENNNVKLIDFGFSTCIPNEKKIKMFCGTPSYMSPQIVLKDEYAGPPADIWASAVLLFALMNGCFPYRGATDKELYRRIQRGTFVLQNQTVTDSFVDLLQRMLNVDADERPTAEFILNDPWFQIDSSSKAAQMEAHKNQAESIADQKRLFKAKILGTAPVIEKVNKNTTTICLNSSKEQLKNLVRGVVPIQGPSINNLPSNPNQLQANNNDFSDYGINQQNVIKKLNQEAYQAYYNTSGCNFGVGNNSNVQNPYYNNFFQNNFMHNNTNMTGNNNNMGFYQGYNNQPMRSSPTQGQCPPTSQGQPPLTSNNNIGTPQVFGSPTGAFHCNGRLINNNFNIINNIIMNQQQPNQSSEGQRQQSETNKGGTRISPKTCENNLQQNQYVYEIPSDQLDEGIDGSVEKLGFNRSQVINQGDSPSQIFKIYARLNEEKLSKTSNLQPLNMRAVQQKHNYGVFPNFVESESNMKKDDTKQNLQNAYFEDINNDDYNIIVMPSQKSPQSIFNQTMNISNGVTSSHGITAGAHVGKN